MRLISALVTVAVMAGGSAQAQTPKPSGPPANIEQTTPHVLRADQVEAVQASIKQRLKDPLSAMFERVSAVTNAKGSLLVCGMVNSKNSYGGYAGRTPFIGLLVGGAEKKLFAPIAVGGTDVEVRATLMSCRNIGISF